MLFINVIFNAPFHQNTTREIANQYNTYDYLSLYYYYLASIPSFTHFSPHHTLTSLFSNLEKIRIRYLDQKPKTNHRHGNFIKPSLDSISLPFILTFDTYAIHILHLGRDVDLTDIRNQIKYRKSDIS